MSLNRWVFKWRLKVRMFSHSRKSAGREFQVDGIGHFILHLENSGIPLVLQAVMSCQWFCLSITQASQHADDDNLKAILSHRQKKI